MIQQFLRHIEKHSLIGPSDKVLLAVSGGLDSMVMLELFQQSPWKVAVAHCNFQLRGNDSVLDETLVSQRSAELGLPCYVKRFEPKKHAEEHGMSMQMAAREQRYAWFKELKDELGFTRIAIAHQLNDSFETLLMNLVRGTGVDGMEGIAVKNDNIIRPLLFASREQVHQFALSNHLAWREDSSNASDDYNRNLIRNQVVPLLRKLNPGLESSWESTQERLAGSKHFVKRYIEEFYRASIKQNVDGLTINRIDLLKEQYAHVLLWEIVKQYGFNYVQCCDVVQNDHQSGKMFNSDGYRLLIDRDKIEVTKQMALDFECQINAFEESQSNSGITLMFKLENAEIYSMQKSPNIAELDYDTLVFPLVWRPWKKGDKVRPLGMKQYKKVSDFLVDEKISVTQKERVTVLESNGDIIWLVGMRIADAHKITNATKRILVIEATIGVN